MSKLIEKVCSKVLTSIRKNAIILQTNKQTNKQTTKQTNKQRYTIPCEGRCGYLVLIASQKRKGAMA